MRFPPRRRAPVEGFRRASLVCAACCVGAAAPRAVLSTLHSFRSVRFFPVPSGAQKQAAGGPYKPRHVRGDMKRAREREHRISGLKKKQEGYLLGGVGAGDRGLVAGRSRESETAEQPGSVVKGGCQTRVKSSQVTLVLSTKIQNSPPLAPGCTGAGSSRRRQN